MEHLDTEWKEGEAPGERRELSILLDAVMVWIPPGDFVLGSPRDEYGRSSEEVRKKVTLTRGFWMLDAPVTHAQFEDVMGYDPSGFEGCENYPVEQVSWYEALAFCNALNERLGLSPCFTQEGEGQDVSCELKEEWKGRRGRGYYACQGFRLPTEAEWEYAARARDQSATYNGDLTDPSEFHWSDFELDPTLDRIAWYNTSETNEVREKMKNRWNLYDMLGNVWEWTWDRHGKRTRNPSTDPVTVPNGSPCVIRGGSFENGADCIRAASRDHLSPDNRLETLGFRVVLGGF